MKTWKLLVTLLLFGASPSQALDLNEDGWKDLIIANYVKDDNYQLNSYIYWGNKQGSYSQKTPIPTQGARGISVADLNQDGYGDIIVSNYSDGKSRQINSYIYWGDPEFYFMNKTNLGTVSGYGQSVADLNQDGFLDIVFSNYSDGDQGDINSYIYWGDPSFEYSRRQNLATHGALSNAIADLNNDGYLDIVFTSNNVTDTSIPSFIYWGDANHSFEQRSEIKTKHAYGLSIYDVNADGFLDIIISEFGPEPSKIFWGNATHDYRNYHSFETTYATANSVSDLDQDGFADITFSCYKTKDGNTRTNSLVFWGDAKATFSKKTELPTNGAHGNSIADLNEDGYPEILIANFHSSHSSIFWGSDKRDYLKVTRFESVGATGIYAGEQYAYGQSVITQKKT